MFYNKLVTCPPTPSPKDCWDWIPNSHDNRMWSSAKQDTFNIKPWFLGAASGGASPRKTWQERSFPAHLYFLPRAPLSSASQRHSERPFSSGSLAAKIVTVQSGPKRLRLCRCPDAERCEVGRGRAFRARVGLVSRRLVAFKSLRRCQSRWGRHIWNAACRRPEETRHRPECVEPPSLGFLSVIPLRRDAVKGSSLP